MIILKEEFEGLQSEKRRQNGEHKKNNVENQQTSEVQKWWMVWQIIHYRLENKTKSAGLSLLDFLKKKKSVNIFHFQINRTHVLLVEIDQKTKWK